MKLAPSTLPNLHFLTAALRSWLVNHLLSDKDLDELVYLLLELGYEETSLPQAPERLRDFLKREMSHLAGDSSPVNNQRLIRICEGLVQFYLLHQGRETPELDQLNLFLPPGLSFSSVSGRLLFEPDDYYQPHNLFAQEQPSWALNQDSINPVQLRRDEQSSLDNRQTAPSGANLATTGPVLSNSSLETLADITAKQDSQEAAETELETELVQADNSLADQAPESQQTARSSEFRSIRQRRLQLLKKLGE